MEGLLTSLQSNVVDHLSSFKTLPRWKQVAMVSGAYTGCCILGSLASYYVNKQIHPETPTVYHTTHGNINSSTNNNILFFIHGFPDFQDLWDLQIKFFQSKGYCCITLELPNLLPTIRI